VQSAMVGSTFLVGNGEGPKLINEQYFLVLKLGLGRRVVGLSLVITEVSRGGGMRWLVCKCLEKRIWIGYSV